MISSYQKLPVVIDAVEWTGTNTEEILEFSDTSVFIEDGNLFIDTLEGQLSATVGDFIIKGTKGEFYPCKPEIFKDIYKKLP